MDCNREFDNNINYIDNVQIEKYQKEILNLSKQLFEFKDKLDNAKKIINEVNTNIEEVFTKEELLKIELLNKNENISIRDRCFQLKIIYTNSLNNNFKRLSDKYNKFYIKLNEEIDEIKEELSKLSSFEDEDED